MFKNNTPPGYKTEAKFGITDSHIRIGIVKNTADITCAGRLEVWIPELGGDENDSSNWYIANYLSPFGGATYVENNTEDGKTLSDTQTSYGFWMIPPDVGNRVAVFFANGSSSNCYWFGCVYAPNMNHMIPGVASDLSFSDGENNVLPPVAEYNKKDSSVDVENPVRPRFDPLHEGLKQQGLYTDFERGPSSTSARRETPSNVYGFLTPRANTIHVDDNEENEFIRFRTRSGTQILISETTGFVYINSKYGNSWMEISDDGIDMYSKGNISIRSEQDVNIRADKNFTIHAGNIGNILSSTLNIQSSADTNQLAGGSIKVTASGDLHFSGVNVNASGSTLNLKASTINEEAGTISQKGSAINRDGIINDNAGKSKSASDATKASQPSMVSHKAGSGTVNSTVSRLPTHEPWAGHPKSSNIDPPRGDTPDMQITSSAIVKEPKTKVIQSQITGEGKTADSKPIKLSGVVTKIGAMSVDKDIIAAIKQGASISNVDFGFLMTMAEKESTFRPKVPGSGSSAYGLFQFTDPTWNSMCKKYSSYGITNSIQDKSNPTYQAIFAGFYAKENQKQLEKSLGRSVNITEMYLAHFLGAGGATKFLKCSGTDLVSRAVSSDALSAKGNRSAFYKKDGSLKTVQETYDDFNTFFISKREAYMKYA